MEYEPEERRPLMRTISEEGVFDIPHSPIFYDISRRKRRAACVTILLTETLERLTFYGIISNFVMFLIQEPFSWYASSALHVCFAFTAISYLFSVIGGLIADTLLGRFKTIFLSLLIYIAGIAFFLLMSYATVDVSFCNKLCGSNLTEEPINSTAPHGLGSDHDVVEYRLVKSKEKTPVLCLWPLLLALCLTAIGGGSVRANLSPFGADQVRHEGPDVIRTFFNWFYWSINIGSLIAILGVSYVQQNKNFFIGNIVVAASLVLALIVFTCGRCTFLTREPMGSVLPNTFKIIGEAFRHRKLRKEAIRRRESHMVNSCPKITFLDMAKKRHGGSFHDSMVEDVKSLKKVIGIFLLLIPYWMVYYQMQSTFMLQGLHMRFTFPDHDGDEGQDAFRFPVAWLTVFDVLVVILLLPILDRIIYPWLTRRGHSVTLYHRILIGMIFSGLSMVAAGVLELERKQCLENRPGCKFNQTVQQGSMINVYVSADVWIFYQIPQYMLIGISEVLASVAALEFAYSHAPKSMQGLIMGLYCLSNGIGSICGSLLVAIFSLPDFKGFNTRDQGNINYSELYLYFFVVGVIQIVATIIFSCVNAKKFLNSKEAVQTGDGSGQSSGQSSRQSSQHVQRRNSASASSSDYGSN